jgi:hypothetical protein
MPQAVKGFSHTRVEIPNTLRGAPAYFLLLSSGMTTIPRDSDIVGAVALLAIVLVTGLFRVLGL